MPCKLQHHENLVYVEVTLPLERILSYREHIRSLKKTLDSRYI